MVLGQRGRRGSLFAGPSCQASWGNWVSCGLCTEDAMCGETGWPCLSPTPSQSLPSAERTGAFRDSCVLRGSAAEGSPPSAPCCDCVISSSSLGPQLRPTVLRGGSLVRVPEATGRLAASRSCPPSPCSAPSPRRPLHPLEADRLLLGRLPHRPEGGGAVRDHLHEAQRQERGECGPGSETRGDCGGAGPRTQRPSPIRAVPGGGKGEPGSGVTRTHP